MTRKTASFILRSGLLMGTLVLLMTSTNQATTVYFIGNSVTDCIKYDGLQALAESRGLNDTWGRVMIPGASLDWLWSHPNDGNTQSPFGGYPTALGQYAWDFLSLQPFDRDIENDLMEASNFINTAKPHSPNLTVIIYERWPRKDGRDATSAAGWNTAFLAPYKDGAFDGSQEGKDYFEKLTLAVRADYAGLPVIIAPVGEVMHQLNIQMAARQIQGYSNIWQVYSDAIHMTGAGSYIMCCTYFATIFKQDPRGLPVPGEFGTLDAGYVQAVQQTVWDVVNNYKDGNGNPWAGVSGGSSTVAVTGVTMTPTALQLTINDNVSLAAAIAPTNATNKAVSWSSSNSSIASVNSSGRVTAVAAGNATITVTTTDGGKTATCAVTVVSSGIAVTGVSIEPLADTVMVGQTVTLTATVVPSNATNKNVSWSSSDSSTASVNASGVVTGKKPGAVTITVTTASGGKTATCAITVSVVNHSPIAVIKALPLSGYAPLTVSFDGTGSHDPDQGDFVLGYDWLFGDGGKANSNASTHTYQTAGTYVVKLDVMDSHDLRGDTTFDTIRVLTFNPSNEPSVRIINDSTVGSGINRFNFSGTWTVAADEAYDGEEHWTEAIGSSYTITFYGAQIKLYGTKDAHHGIASVTIDGGTPVVVDFYASTRAASSLVWTSPVLTKGNHSITVTHSGRKNTASTGTVIIGDRVDIYQTAGSTGVLPGIPHSVASMTAPLVKIVITDISGKIVRRADRVAAVGFRNAVAGLPRGMYPIMTKQDGLSASRVMTVVQ